MTEAFVEYDRTAQRVPNSEPQTPAEQAEIGLALRHILVPLDGSKAAERVLPYVVEIARATPARVTLLQVLEVTGGMATGRQHVDAIEWEMARAESHAYLTSIATRLQNERLAAEIELVQGRAAEQIVLYVNTMRSI